MISRREHNPEVIGFAKSSSSLALVLAPVTKGAAALNSNQMSTIKIISTSHQKLCKDNKGCRMQDFCFAWEYLF